ncbi:MAG: efflux RND transporter permease subunit [Deltaproteobacteria bacterium]|nr:efflux RND transporter permease subunit [Deltaproteobacteria bacterium]MBW2360824.1 efflux RND transporter permease subunit [Deltaproteobacteria bacterium]
MNRIIAWFAANHVAANLLMFVMVIGGLLALPTILFKPFPDIDVDQVTVSVEYRGAAPEETEESVCVRIEEEVEGVDGIKKIRSTAVEGACTVRIELLSGADVDRAVDDVKNRVDAIDTFPEETEKPVIAKVTNQRSVIELTLSGPTTERSLKQVAERVRDEISSLPGITQVSVVGTRPYEISIEVSEQSLRRFALSFDDVARAVQRFSLDLPGGSVKTEGEEILLRTKSQAYWGPEFERILVLADPSGTRVTLADVATVRDTFEDTDQASIFDGAPAVLIRVFRVGDQDAVELAASVRDYIENQVRLPQGLTLTVWQDSTDMLRSRLNLMLKNGRNGFLLVVLVLALFLQLRLAFWVSIGIPIALLGTLFLFPMIDFSIDVISLFAFILVLGILVDDAIVVGENVHRHILEGDDRLEAAIRGAQEVSVPVIFGVLTTVVAFGPLMLVPGFMGQIFGLIASVVVISLLFSLVESQLVLPSHLASGSPDHVASSRAIPVAWRALQSRFAASFERLGRVHYRRALHFALENRYLTIAVAVALLMWTLGLTASGRLPFSFFPPLEADYVAAKLTMPQGTPAAATRRAVEQIAGVVPELRRRIAAEGADAGEPIILHVQSSIGDQPFSSSSGGPPGQNGAATGGGSHLGEVVLALTESEERDISTREVADRWRELVGAVPDAVELAYASSLFSAGEAINIQLRGPDVTDLTVAAERVKAALSGYAGVVDVADSFRAGKREVKLNLLPSGEALGLSRQDLARQVRQAFYGEEAQRIQRGRDDVRVMVRYPEAQRRSLGDLEDMRIRAPDGSEVPFRSVGQVDLGRGYATIRRSDRQRVVNVTADVDRDVTTENEVLAHLQGAALPQILADYPAVSYSLEGAQAEQREAFTELLRWYGFALFGIYALLAIPLRSYLQPLLIMSVIPFGLVGAIAGHLLMGRGLSFMSVQGIIALSGVVVNSSLVLVHYVNQQRAKGVAIADAVAAAGSVRFRPIILTSLTTFAGLTPLLLETSTQAQFLIPMAISLAFGVLFASAITLFIVPSGYLILEDARKWPRGLGNRVKRFRAARRGEPAPLAGP